MKYLTNSEYENLKWEGQFKYPNMVRLRVEADGSCLFHAIAKSYFKPYIMGIINNKPINRKKFVQKLRKSLSMKLGTRTDPKDPESPTHYDLLSRGQLSEFAKAVPSYSLENMKNELDSNHPVDNVYNEFISNELDKDIYILDGNKHDVYMVGNEDEILYKNRDSIVLLYLPGHYELVGVEEDGIIQTLFKHDHSFIRTIRKRMEMLMR